MSVGQFQGAKSQPPAYFLFISRVDVVRFSDVDGNGLCRIGQRERSALGFAQDGPVTLSRLRIGCQVVGQLNEKEREVANAPLRSRGSVAVAPSLGVDQRSASKTIRPPAMETAADTAVTTASVGIP